MLYCVAENFQYVRLVVSKLRLQKLLIQLSDVMQKFSQLTSIAHRIRNDPIIFTGYSIFHFQVLRIQIVSRHHFLRL